MANTTGNPYGLTDLQVRFCQEYVKNLNATQAYLRAGYSVSSNRVARAAASRLLSKVNIKAYLGEVANLDEVSVVAEVTKIAFANITDVLNISPDSITLKAGNELSERAKSAIQSISIVETKTVTVDGETTRTTVQVKMHDKLSALEKLMKKLKAYPKDIPVLSAMEILLSEGVATSKQAEIVARKMEEMQTELGNCDDINV
jgi:phage terminase small subunit